MENNNLISLPHRIVIADNFWTRLRGLMFRRKPIKDEALLLTPCNSIHMCFMFFSIDVVFLDKDQKIVYLKQRVRPWSFVPPVRTAHYTLELPLGTIQNHKLYIGDHLKL
ncbi:DUF192 domain-containing protein [Anaerobacillus sp. MEB173]|uniref:DUF192 domain-containing protein n=1 Tax=Anaerobacillus sp. MEB173 TaxID=3383345 RepID=UPI003F938B1E